MGIFLEKRVKQFWKKKWYFLCWVVFL